MDSSISDATLPREGNLRALPPRYAVSGITELVSFVRHFVAKQAVLSYFGIEANGFPVGTHSVSHVIAHCDACSSGSAHPFCLRICFQPTPSWYWCQDCKMQFFVESLPCGIQVLFSGGFETHVLSRLVCNLRTGRQHWRHHDLWTKRQNSK